ncbi:MAG: SsrA-binding protein SmpB [Bdellovibrionales bacterium]|nr:SsrA-binding protein SmpB [Bdellovibrionales bacterium]
MSKKTIAFNKKASFQYEIKEKLRAGLVLLGSEVKSLREGSCHLKDSYIAFIGEEAFLQKSYIGPYKKALHGGHNPERKRKLLLNKKELQRIRGLLEEKKMACIPTEIYFQKGLVKIEIALGLGKSLFDKRQSLKKKQAHRQIERALKQKKSRF